MKISQTQLAVTAGIVILVFLFLNTQKDENLSINDREPVNAEQSSDNRFCNPECKLRWSPDFIDDFFKIKNEYTFINKEKLENDINSIHWAHSMDLMGIQTPGTFSQASWPLYLETVLPKSLLNGKTFLDIGSWDGLFSFYSEKQGAIVTSMDYCCWGGNEPHTTRHMGWKSNCCSTGDGTGYMIAHKVLKSKAKTIRLNVYDLSPEIAGTFDITFFSGVLYHLKHPLLALEQLASVTKECIIVETHVALLPPHPDSITKSYIEFYGHTELANDPSNWVGPNEQCMIDMLETVGFPKVEVIYKNHQRFVFLARRQ